MSETGDRKKNLRCKIILGGAVAVAAGAYLLHRKSINALIEMHQVAVQDTMWASFDEGVKYGLSLAKQTAAEAKEVSQYAFGAFDKPA